jgi:hypothetical protein
MEVCGVRGASAATIKAAKGAKKAVKAVLRGQQQPEAPGWTVTPC